MHFEMNGDQSFSAVVEGYLGWAESVGSKLIKGARPVYGEVELANGGAGEWRDPLVFVTPVKEIRTIVSVLDKFGVDSRGTTVKSRVWIGRSAPDLPRETMRVQSVVKSPTNDVTVTVDYLYESENGLVTKQIKVCDHIPLAKSSATQQPDNPRRFAWRVKLGAFDPR